MSSKAAPKGRWGAKSLPPKIVVGKWMEGWTTTSHGGGIGYTWMANVEEGYVEPDDQVLSAPILKGENE